jgi:hypothetical protein
MDGAVSEWKPMLAAMPQGSTLPLMLHTGSLCTSGVLNSVRIELAVYVDDICIYDPLIKHAIS